MEIENYLLFQSLQLNKIFQLKYLNKYILFNKDRFCNTMATVALGPAHTYPDLF